ncbi:MAG: SEL1-like repeat protein [Lachnospiraceae bacterium]|nr:SEL1-like repeat protein [Lachnospiraceae bacterium]
MADWWNDENLVKQVYEEAKGGNTAAQCELARQLMLMQHMEEALSWYKRAAAAGESDAMFNLGLIYSQGLPGNEPSWEEAFFWYEQAAAAGDAEGMYMAGDCCLRGVGTHKDMEQAAVWLKKSLSAGYMAAQELLYQIPGMQEERSQLLTEIESAAKEGERFLEEEDYEKAILLLQKALEVSCDKLGESDACTILIMNNLAVALAAAERFDQSIPLKERVLELRGKCLSLTHPDYLTAVTNLTSDYARVGRYQSALNLSKQAYTGARESLPITHEVTLLAANRLAADFMNLCRHDLAYELLKAVDELVEEACRKTKSGRETEDMVGFLPERSLRQWKRAQTLMQLCRETMEENAVYFKLDEARKSYACICAELCEMLDGLPEEYLHKIKEEEYAHLKEQAALAGCYRPHLNSGQAVEVDPYTNALQTLITLKYLMPAVAECREELDGIQCRAVATWMQNELCMVVTVYPRKSTVEHMEHPQPADFVKSLNACKEPGEPVLSLEAVDLQMKRLENGQVQICFAYGADSKYRMIRMYYIEETNQLEGEACFTEIESR